MRFTALTLSGLALVLFACSSESPSTASRGASTAGAADRNGADDADDKSGTSSSSGGSTNADPTEPAAGGACGGQAKMEACFQCCEGQAPGAVEVLDEAFGDCVCAADKCATACAQTACNADNPTAPQDGDACDQCLVQHGEACDQVMDDACEKDPACVKLFECADQAKCYDKPE